MTSLPVPPELALHQDAGEVGLGAGIVALVAVEDLLDAFAGHHGGADSSGAAGLDAGIAEGKSRGKACHRRRCRRFCAAGNASGGGSFPARKALAAACGSRAARRSSAGSALAPSTAAPRASAISARRRRIASGPVKRTRLSPARSAASAVPGLVGAIQNRARLGSRMLAPRFLDERLEPAADPA